MIHIILTVHVIITYVSIITTQVGNIIIKWVNKINDRSKYWGFKYLMFIDNATVDQLGLKFQQEDSNQMYNLLMLYYYKQDFKDCDDLQEKYLEFAILTLIKLSFDYSF